MKSLHDYFGEYRAARKRRERMARVSWADESRHDEMIEAAYWRAREALKVARAGAGREEA